MVLAMGLVFDSFFWIACLVQGTALDQPDPDHPGHLREANPPLVMLGVELVVGVGLVFLAVKLLVAARHAEVARNKMRAAEGDPHVVLSEF
jgi:hypothetical protein